MDTKGITLAEDLQNNFLQCFLCKRGFTDPKLLLCGHSFCLKCLEGKFRHIEDNMPKCPVCKEDAIDAYTSLADLPSNVSIHSLKERTSLADGEGEKKEAKIMCSHHSDQELYFYCRTSGLPICSSCKMLDDHAGHSCVDVSTVAREVNLDVHASLKELDVASRCFTVNVSRLRSMITDLNKQCDNAAEKVRKRGDLLRKVVEEIESSLLKEIEETRDSGNQELEGWLSTAEVGKKVVKEARNDAASFVSKSHPVQVLSMHKRLQNYLSKTGDDAKKYRQSAKLASWSEISVTGPTEDQVRTTFTQSFGSVNVQPVQCHRLSDFTFEEPVKSIAVIGKHIIACSADEKSVKIYKKSGELYDEFEMADWRPCDVAVLGSELYVANFASDQVRVYNQEKGKYYHKGNMSLKEHGITTGEKFIALDNAGHVFVSYESGNCVNVYNKKKELCAAVTRERYNPLMYAGLHIATLGLASLFMSQTNSDKWCPRHVAAASDGALIVASHRPARIQAVTAGGDRLFAYDVPYPASVGVDVYDNVIVAEGGIGGKLHLVSSGGYLLQTFAMKEDKAVLRAITFDPEGNLLVAYSVGEEHKLATFSYVYTVQQNMN